ncbi:MAG: type 1 glutamine amidotransferase-like domain-containing protein [bacterium]|nr:type 1 glutamine amidotransferase-like domain-containing protein [bacterium]
MKFYLSSFHLGDQSAQLVRFMAHNKHIAYIPNACDYTNVDWERRDAAEKFDMESLEHIGLTVEYLDLQEYFGRTDDLRKTLHKFGGVFVRGGNTFILRQAMKLSGFDVIFEELLHHDSFVYAGYSAGICVLAPDFRALQIVDDPTDKPYKECQDTLWEGLGFLEYIILPHYISDHPESADIEKEVAFAEKHHIPFKTLRDGDVIIIE